jgi:hypothetical protein
MREVWAEINGTIIGLDDISVENEGELYIWSYANTEGYHRMSKTQVLDFTSSTVSN